MRVDATTYVRATLQIEQWANRRESRVVCVANVHMVMESYDDEQFREIVNAADLVTPDGMPLVWAIRMLGVGAAQRVYGPQLMLELCSHAARSGIPVALIGGTDLVLAELNRSLPRRFPGLTIAYSFSPPFRQISSVEEERMLADLHASEARIVLVGLGCPKQERWMSRQRARIMAPMVGVGAAFDFNSGRKKQAPQMFQEFGLEWLFRLSIEPRRLWKRYVYHNPRFIALFAAQVARARAPWQA